MIYKLLPPTDPRVLSSIAPFDKEEFKKEEKIELNQKLKDLISLNYLVLIKEKKKMKLLIKR